MFFISYASDDRERVSPFYDKLKSHGYKVWMDCKELAGGQNWDIEIQKAFNKSALIIAFISKNSYTKRGYIQRELKFALRNLEEKLPDDIYIIPIQLDAEIERPPQLTQLQFISADAPDCLGQIERSISLQLERFGEKYENFSASIDLHLKSHKLKEEWDGCPGYKFEADQLFLSSVEYENTADISESINSSLKSYLLRLRKTKFEQDLNLCNFGQPKSMRLNTYDITFNDMHATDQILSIRYMIEADKAGCVHYNYWTKCYNFTLAPVTEILSLEEIFIDPDKALEYLQQDARAQLASILEKERGDAWLLSGTESWVNFNKFYFEDKGIQIDFSPYQVASFSEGLQQITIKYDFIKNLLKRPFYHMLIREEYL